MRDVFSDPRIGDLIEYKPDSTEEPWEIYDMSPTVIIFRIPNGHLLDAPMSDLALMKMEGWSVRKRAEENDNDDT